MLTLTAARNSLRISRRRWLESVMAGSSMAWPTAASLLAADLSAGKARHCIYVYLCGGPSQIDLWDPKPDAPEGIRGVFRPIETNVPGIRFTELIPNVARHADKLAVIRSMTHTSPDHNVGSSHTLEGRRPIRPDDVYAAPADHPGLGAILHRTKGDTGILPPWVILPRKFTTSSPPIKGQSGGFLGSKFDPFALDEPKRDSLAPKDLRFEAFDLPTNVTADRFGQRNRLRQSVGFAGGQSSRWNSLEETATEMLAGGKTANAFDLTREDPKLRDRYGRNEYGQSLLLARRLVESGVRFVNVFWTYFDEKGCQFNLWDNHGVATDICGVGGVRKGVDMLTHRYCTPSFDQAFPALLEDLQNRGLLDETLVVVAGEFGRTPKINDFSGRDHWPNCYTQLMAGGGVRGGQIYGASDRIGGYVKDMPVTPEDFHATVLHAFGIDSETMIEDRLARPIRVTNGSPLVSLF